MKFRMRINDIEIRPCDSSLTSSGEHTTLEMVKHEDGVCFTVAFWRRKKDGFALEFVGNRVFKYVPVEIFFGLGNFGQTYLDEYILKE